MKKKILFFLSLFSTSLTFGQAGTLDPTFGTGGKYSFQKHNYFFNVSAKQADDKIILAGRYNDSASNDPGNFCMVRLNTDGTIDSTFGDNGFTTLAFTSYSEEAGAINVQPDGKIVLAGWSNYNGNVQIFMGAVARFNSNGIIDSSFATNGKRFVDLGGTTLNQLYTIGFQSSGKIILGGRASDRAAICRLNIDGTMDATFGNGGVFNGPNNTTFSYLRGMAVQQDDKIVGTNSYDISGISATSVIRITANGQIDSSFGLNGNKTVSFATSSFTEDVKIQNDNKIVVVTNVGGVTLLRLLSDGGLDNSFGTAGRVTTNYLPNAIGGSWLAIQPSDGKIIVSCLYKATNQTFGDYKVLRYNVNGTLDNEFGLSGGTSPVDFYNLNDASSGVYVLNDGKILVAGSSYGGSAIETYYSFIRYNSCGINISNQPSNITKTEGGTATFTVGSSSPSASYQWQNKTGNTWTNLSNGGQYSGVQTATLSIANLTMSNNLAVFRAVGISGACADTSNAATLTVEAGGTGIQNVFTLNGIKVYPNPAKDLLQIEMNTAQYNGTAFIISDITGKEIKTGLLKNTINTISVATMTSGVYFLKIDGIGTMKLIKE